MFVISKKCRTLKPQKVKVNFVPKLLLEVNAWLLYGGLLGGLLALASLERNRTSCRTLLNKTSLVLLVATLSN